MSIIYNRKKKDDNVINRSITDIIKFIQNFNFQIILKKAAI